MNDRLTPEAQPADATAALDAVALVRAVGIDRAGASAAIMAMELDELRRVAYELAKLPAVALMTLAPEVTETEVGNWCDGVVLRLRELHGQPAPPDETPC